MIHYKICLKGKIKKSGMAMIPWYSSLQEGKAGGLSQVWVQPNLRCQFQVNWNIERFWVRKNNQKIACHDGHDLWLSILYPMLPHKILNKNLMKK